MFEAGASRIIHNALMKGGTVKFKIEEKEYRTTVHNFEISNARYYENAYRLLLEKEK